MYCGQTVRRKKLAIPLDRAITTTYKLLKVTMSLSAAFWSQFECSASVCSRHLRAPNYRILF